MFYDGKVGEQEARIHVPQSDSLMIMQRSRIYPMRQVRAIVDYSVAIVLDPSYTYAYINRGIAKEVINDLRGAFADGKQAANLGDPDAANWVAKQFIDIKQSHV